MSSMSRRWLSTRCQCFASATSKRRFWCSIFSSSHCRPLLAATSSASMLRAWASLSEMSRSVSASVTERLPILRSQALRALSADNDCLSPSTFAREAGLSAATVAAWTLSLPGSVAPCASLACSRTCWRSRKSTCREGRRPRAEEPEAGDGGRTLHVRVSSGSCGSRCSCNCSSQACMTASSIPFARSSCRSSERTAVRRPLLRPATSVLLA
mmetsp:Transcript_6220/g.18382  ORF Transcript_6220/g.18382 Transcript_6220/m.18382 type:complete len:212 (-) Transcript_6220:563-1198(-)